MRQRTRVILAAAAILVAFVIVVEWAAGVDFSVLLSAEGFARFAVVAGLLILGGTLLYREFENYIRERTQALEQAKAKDEALLSSIGDGVIATDIQGKIIFINQVALEKLRWNPKVEILGRKAIDVIHLENEAGKSVP